MLRLFIFIVGILALALTIEIWADAVISTIRFEDVTSRSGVQFVADSCPTPNKNQPETMISGVGLIDYDNDGYLDIFFINGAALPSLKKESSKYYNRLFHNNHDGTFTDVTEKAGLAGDGYDMGVAVGDFDNDGWEDIYVASVTKNHLYRNNGNGTFTDVTDKAGVGAPTYKGQKMWSAAAGWVDYNNDGKLDLFVSNYCKWEVNKDPVCLSGGRLRAYCHPKFYEPLPSTLYRNNGDGTFTDVSEETGISKHLSKGMGIGFNDYDGDGFTDIFVANDNMPNALFHNLKGKTFEEVAMDAGVAYSENGKAVSGMGAEFRDLDNDGLPDIWHTATELETFPLFRNRGNGIFIDVTGRSGLARPTLQMSGWSNGVADFDNDGLKDLFVARGNVLDNIAEFSSRTYGEPNTIFRNLGKMTFQDVTAQAGPDMQISEPYRGAAIGDLDNDGRLDMVVTVLNGKARILRNVSANNNSWIAFKLVGTHSNRMAIGAQLKLTTEDGNSQYDIVSTSAGYGASRDPRPHFGLGAFKTVKQLEIRWPSGARQVLKDLPANKIHRIEEP
ncbi:MAG TPA: CRTAC1 family protein [Candidatus Sulfotelmatobacter sp.]|nr:CRTAC1 family protein [Candidatus Sulfotelmatobacter sp.]